MLADPLVGGYAAPASAPTTTTMTAHNNPSTRTNLEENTIMKREMQPQMVFQNKMRALKQQELDKYKDTVATTTWWLTTTTPVSPQQPQQFPQEEQQESSSTTSTTSIEAEAARGLAELQRKAEGGDADSQFELGERYYRGFGVEENKVPALELFLKAAAQGHPGDNSDLGFTTNMAFAVSREMQV